MVFVIKEVFNTAAAVCSIVDLQADDFNVYATHGEHSGTQLHGGPIFA